jgi:RNA polymerase sigma factor for flagellar operon FliA
MVSLTRPKGKKEYFGSEITEQQRNEMVLEYMHLVRTIARHVCSGTSSNVEYDDLVSAGTFGLISAINNYDIERNVSFSTYSKMRIRGAMLDELRQLDWVPRHARRRSNRLSKAKLELQSVLDRKPNREELAAKLEIDMAEFVKYERDAEPLTTLSLDTPSYCDDEGQAMSGIIADNRFNAPWQNAQNRDVKEFIVKSLTPMEKLVVTLYYYEQMTMREVGQTLCVSESRVSQMHSEILKRLRERIETKDTALAMI